MDTIKLLDGTVSSIDYLKEKARDDDYYYNYLGKVAFSSTIINTLLNSPKQYYYLTKYGSSNETSSLALGKIIHAMALTPELYEEQFEVVDVASKNTKKFKEAKESSTKILLTKTEENQANRVVESLLKNEAFISRLYGSTPEEPAIGEIMGYPFRGKADILRAPKLFDLKTTTDLRAFPYSAKKYGYDVQAYIYCTLFGVDYKDFEFVVIDKSSLDLGIYTVSEDFYLKGKDKVERALDTYTHFFAGKNQEEVLEAINDYYITGEL